MSKNQGNHQADDGPGVLHQPDHDCPHEEADETDGGLLACLLGAELGQIVVLGKVQAQRRLAGTGCDAANGPQGLACAHCDGLAPESEVRAAQLEEEGRVVEEVGEEAVPLGLWLDPQAKAMGKDNGCYVGDCISEDGEQHGVGGRRVGVADAQALEQGPTGEEGGDGGEEGLEGVVGLVGEIVVGDGLWEVDGKKGREKKGAPVTQRAEKALASVDLTSPVRLETIKSTVERTGRTPREGECSHSLGS